MIEALPPDLRGRAESREWLRRPRGPVERARVECAEHDLLVATAVGVVSLLVPALALEVGFALGSSFLLLALPLVMILGMAVSLHLWFSILCRSTSSPLSRTVANAGLALGLALMPAALLLRFLALLG